MCKMCIIYLKARREKENSLPVFKSNKTKGEELWKTEK